MDILRHALAAWRRLWFPPWLHVEILLHDRRERRRLRRALRRAAWALDRLDPPLRLELIVQRSVVDGDRALFGDWRVRPSGEGRLVVMRLAAQVGREVVPAEELVDAFVDSVVDLAEICGQQSEIRVPVRGPVTPSRPPLGSPATPAPAR
jgi:hypothetical protein